MTIISDGIVVLDEDNLRCWCLLICNASCNHTKNTLSQESATPVSITTIHRSTNSPLADPEFPRGGASIYYLAKICRKLHENKKNEPRGGASKILLCRSATAHGHVEWTATIHTTQNSQSAAELFTCYKF